MSAAKKPAKAGIPMGVHKPRGDRRCHVLTAPLGAPCVYIARGGCLTCAAHAAWEDRAAALHSEAASDTER